MLRQTFLFCLLSCVSLLIKAQDIQSNTEGLNAEVGFSATGWSSKYFTQLDEISPFGLGGKMRVGYGLNQRFEPFASYEAYTLNLKKEWRDYYRMSCIGLGLRVNFGGTLQRIRPYIEVAYNNVRQEVSPVIFNNRAFVYRMKGGNFAAGAGVRFFISPKLAANAHLMTSMGKFNSFTLDGIGINDIPDVRTFRGSIGLCYFFGF
ncbi:MAG: outer membrane beta-barrel protein [Runella sp.]